MQKIRMFIEHWGKSKYSLRYLIGRLLLKTRLNRFFTIRMHGYKINFSDANLAFALFKNSKDRHWDEEFLQEILRPGQIYVDVGANIGTLALTAASIVGSNGKVIAIEAHPATFKYLKDNVSLNGFLNIALINVAVGEKAGKIFFSDDSASDDQNKVLLQDLNGIEVQVDMLDNLICAEPRIDFLKIDVEGYEKFVLEGAQLILAKTNIIFFESWEKHFAGFGYTTAELIGLLKRLGFEVYKPASNSLMCLPDTYQSLDCENLVAIKDTTTFCANYGYTVINIV